MIINHNLPSFVVRDIIKPIRQYIDRYHLIQPNSKIILGYSGGKDSLVLIMALAWLRQRHIYEFDMEVIHVDPGYGADFSQITPYFDQWQVPFHIEVTNINEQIDLDEAASVCYRCGRLRKGVLRRLAVERGAQAIALGHHQDELVETFFMNLFEVGSLGGIAPKHLQDDMALIRPMLGVSEQAIQRAVEILKLPIITACCPYNGKTQRQVYKDWIAQQALDRPHIKARVVSALGNVNPSKLLKDW